MAIFNTVYGWEWWIPNANTIAYYPLTATSINSDMSWNWNTLTTNTWVVFWTYAGVSCAYANSKYLRWSVTNLPSWASARTTSIWFYAISYNSSQTWIFSYWDNSSGKRWCMMALNSWWQKAYLADSNGDVSDGAITTWTWYNMIATYDGTTAKLYLNGQLGNSWTKVLDTYLSDIWIWAQNWNTQIFNWYLSEAIVENRAWSDAEILSYYNKTKSNYGL